MAGDFTPTQGRYLSFIAAYIEQHGYPPAEADIAAAMCVSPPSVNQMVKMLEKRGLILRHPGQPRSLVILIADEEIPPWKTRKNAAATGMPKKKASRPPTAPPANLYVLSIYLQSGPISKKFPHKIVQRVIEIRGDQTLEQLHDAIFSAYDRFDQHLYQFQFGKRPFDPKGPNYGIPDPESKDRDARRTTLDQLKLKPRRAFGYWFDFGDDWFHQIDVERIEAAIPTVTYPRVIKRVGASPPQYAQDDE